MAWKPGESGNLSGRPPESISVKKARKMLERASPRLVQQLLRLVDKAEEAGDIKAALTGVTAALKKVMADAQPAGIAPPAEADPAKLAADAQRILADFMAKHGLGEPPAAH